MLLCCAVLCNLNSECACFLVVNVKAHHPNAPYKLSTHPHASAAASKRNVAMRALDEATAPARTTSGIPTAEAAAEELLAGSSKSTSGTAAARFGAAAILTATSLAPPSPMAARSLRSARAMEASAIRIACGPSCGGAGEAAAAAGDSAAAVEKRRRRKAPPSVSVSSSPPPPSAAVACL